MILVRQITLPVKFVVSAVRMGNDNPIRTMCVRSMPLVLKPRSSRVWARS